MDFEKALTEVEPSTALPVDLPEFAGNHKLVFLRSRAKNFRSIGNEWMEINYTKSRATLVISDENGSGKSTMTVWVPYYAITGQTYSSKEVLGGLVNSTFKKAMVVEFEFMARSDTWKIVRGREPKVFELHKLVDGKWAQYKREASDNDLQDTIWELLGLDPKAGPKILENACILGRDRFVPFLLMSASERRLMVESIWDLGIFRHMSEISKEEVSKRTKEQTALGYKIDTACLKKDNITENLTRATNDLKTHEEHLVELERHCKIKVNNYQDQIAATRAEIAQLEAGDDASTVRRRKELTDLIEALETELTTISTKLSEELTAKQGEREKLRNSLLLTKEESEKALNGVKEQIDKEEAELVKLNELLSGANERLTPVQLELQEVSEKLTKAKEYRPRILADFEHAKQRKEKFETMGECPVCEQHLSTEKLDAVRAEVQPLIDEADGKLSKLDALIDKHTNHVTEIRATIKGIQDEISTLQAKQSACNANLSKLKNESGSYEMEAMRASDKLEVLPTSESVEESVTNRYGKQEAEIKADIAKNKHDLDALANTSDKLIASKYNSITTTEQLIESEQASLKERLEYEHKLIAEVKGDIEKYSKEQGETQALIDQMDAEYNTLSKDIEEFKFTTELVGEKEGKADVIRSYLPFLNAKINEFLESMNLFLGLRLDEQFNVFMDNPARKGQTLFSLSTGQRARVDLAIIFAFREVANLKASFQTNLFVLDEALENLSERGTLEAIGMIKDKFQHNNLFVITQRNKEFTEHFETQIKYGLRGDLTVVL